MAASGQETIPVNASDPNAPKTVDEIDEKIQVTDPKTGVKAWKNVADLAPQNKSVQDYLKKDEERSQRIWGVSRTEMSKMLFQDGDANLKMAKKKWGTMAKAAKQLNTDVEGLDDFKDGMSLEDRKLLSKVQRMDTKKTLESIPNAPISMPNPDGVDEYIRYEDPVTPDSWFISKHSRYDVDKISEVLNQRAYDKIHPGSNTDLDDPQRASEEEVQKQVTVDLAKLYDVVMLPGYGAKAVQKSLKILATTGPLMQVNNFAIPVSVGAFSCDDLFPESDMATGKVQLRRKSEIFPEPGVAPGTNQGDDNGTSPATNTDDTNNAKSTPKTIPVKDLETNEITMCAVPPPAKQTKSNENATGAESTENASGGDAQPPPNRTTGPFFPSPPQNRLLAAG